MRVTVMQMNSGTDKARNLEQARQLCADAVVRDRPDLVSFPEMIAWLGGSDSDRRDSAEPIPGGETYRFLQETARTHSIFVHGGSYFERVADGDRIFNTSVAFDRQGRELARYRKIHLFDIVAPDGAEYRESDVVGQGGDIVTYDAEGVRVGCTICYDIRFGELYRRLAEAGAQVIAVPAAFTLQTGKDHWEVLLRARAIETQTYIVAAAQWGRFPMPEGPRQSWGHAMIVDPWGHVVAQASDGIGFATAELDLEYLDRVRQRIPVASHRVLPG